MLEKCVLTILELNRNQRLGHKKTKLNICHQTLTLSTQLQNRKFHVVERTITSSKCQKMKNARAKRAKILFFIVKYANLWGFCCRRRRGCLSSLFTANKNCSPRWTFTGTEENNCFSILSSPCTQAEMRPLEHGWEDPFCFSSASRRWIAFEHANLLMQKISLANDFAHRADIAEQHLNAQESEWS